VTPVKWGAEN